MTRLARGILVWGQPTPLQALQALCAARPEVYVTGDSLAGLLFGEELTFPIHVAVEATTLAPSELFVSYRSKRISAMSKTDCSEAGLTTLGLRAEAPVGAARVCTQPARLLERYYEGNGGKSRLLRHLKGYDRTPPGIAQLLNDAAIGADSDAERELVRLLRERGFKVSSNVRLGDYLWDIKLDDYLIVIDVDGFRFHKGKAEHYDVFVTDRWKTNAAQSLGYVTFRYPARCVAEAAGTVLAQIADAVEELPAVRKKPRQFDFAPAFIRGVRSWHPFFVVPERDMYYY